MIISQTPFRVSFAGGGTDLPAFYREEYGAVLSVTIQRHMYVTVHNRFESTFRVAYSKIETAESVDDIQHGLVRESLRTAAVEQPLEVTTIADVPAGTGMSSSSALTVGLLNTFHAFEGRIASREQLAQEACRIEIGTLGHPIGKQDQYAAAYGGMNYIRFNPNESVQVEPVPMKSATRAELEKRVLLLYTNQTRDANQILRAQSSETKKKMDVLTEMRDLANTMRYSLTGTPDLNEFSRLLDHGWELKRSLGFRISNEKVDSWYELAKRAGAQGGKLLGAGGGGFLLLLAPSDSHERIRAALGHPEEVSFHIDPVGSRIIFLDRNE